MQKWTSKDYLRYFAPAIAVTLIGFVVAYQFADPAPPRRITIATGLKEGAYYSFGSEYAKLLAQDGVVLNVRETSGSLENLQLVSNPDSGIDIAFIQGGVSLSKPTDNLLCLASLYYEPLWVFYRAGLPVRYISDLRGMRLAVGREGSGTRQLSVQLLALNGVTAENSRFLPMAADESTELLTNGEVDALFVVVSHRAEAIQRLLTTPGIELLDFRRGDAYTKRFRYLSLLVIPEGVIDFVKNIPAQDIHILAPTTQLVVRNNFHPALTDIILTAAEEIHGQGGLFEKRNEFPAPKFLDFPLSSDADGFYKSGPPFLRRFLPFWLANFLIRMKIMLLPLLALFIPLVKLLPPFYRWRVRSRIFRWYDQLAKLDQELLADGSDRRLGELVARLNWIEGQVTRISVPLGYSKDLYDMRVHIDLLRRKLAEAGLVTSCSEAARISQTPATPGEKPS
jgi:TRAP transporter TAXI family solute receptor